jgi:hypothetical protein
MASFNFTSVVLDEGTTFIVGSWICVANGLGGFNSHLANSREPEASSSTPSSDLDKFHRQPRQAAASRSSPADRNDAHFRHDFHS